MIHFLKGVVEELGDDYLAIDVNGVGYQLFASGRTLGQVAVGEALKIHVHTHVREDQFTLYGFVEFTERDMFTLLTKVNGVGMKVALAILSSLSTEEIISAITLQDGKMIARANGVGPKLGERVVRELKDKVGTIPAADGASIAVTTGGGGITSDVLSALTNLGYKPVQAQQAMKTALANLGEEADFDAVFRASLAELM